MCDWLHIFLLDASFGDVVDTRNWISSSSTLTANLFWLTQNAVSMCLCTTETRTD